MQNRKLIFLFYLLFVFITVKAQTSDWTLEQCIETALNNNVAVQQSFNAMEVSAVNLKQDKNNLLPTLNGSATETFGSGRTLNPSDYQFVNDNVWSSNFSLNGALTLFDGFQNKNSIKQSQLNYESAKNDVENSKNEITISVVNAYLQILYAMELIKNSEKQVESTTLQMERIRELVDIGLKPENEVLQLKAQLASDNVSSSEAVGKTIRINKIPFIIMGVLAEKGQGSFGQDQDDIILAPFRTVQKRVMGISHTQQIVVSAISEDHIDQAKAEISETLIKRQNKIKNGEPEFTLQSLSEITNMLGTITNVLTILLASIASISLVVGGIGIMNIMLVSVTERTREIGLRLAVGAPGNAILMQFLSEAIALCLVGGVIGVILGYGITALVSSIMDWPVIISTSSIVLSFGFSSFVGVVFGYFPARKASRLHPIEALRYE